MVRLALDHSPSELHFPPSDAGRAAPPPSRHEGAFHPMSLGPPVHQFSWGSTLEKPPPTLPSTIASGSTSFQSGIPLRVRVQTELDDARLEAAEAARRRARLLTASLSEPALLPPRRDSWRGGAREAQLAFEVLHGHSHMTFTPPRRASLSPPRHRAPPRSTRCRRCLLQPRRAGPAPCSTNTVASCPAAEVEQGADDGARAPPPPRAAGDRRAPAAAARPAARSAARGRRRRRRHRHRRGGGAPAGRRHTRAARRGEGAAGEGEIERGASCLLLGNGLNC